MRKRFEIFSQAFDRKGMLLSSSLNSYSKSHPLQLYFSKQAGMSDQRVYLHSELACLIKATGRLGKDSRSVHTLLVQRFDSKGCPVLCKPCDSCMLAIQAYGVKILKYTDNGKLVTVEL